MGTTELEDLGIDVIRGIAMDGPHAARSGHQGTAMALAPLAHVLWTRVMKYDAAAPDWPDRDRFILSNGHASILQYAMLHLTGTGLTLDDLRDFRQWGSLTPGHPEVHHTAGVEVTTGPLGQGFANGVGMALAERWLRHRLGAEVCDHHIYVTCGDGDLSEGVSHEAASFAGHQGLGRLVCIYDDNHISIDGPTELTLSDDAARRFESYGWEVLQLGEAGEDLDALTEALNMASEDETRPTMIVLRTHIGFPSPDVTDDHEAHGYALFDEEIAATKRVMGLDPDAAFTIPEEVLELYRNAGRRGAAARAAWDERVRGYSGDRAVLDRTLEHGFSIAAADMPTWDVGSSVATRKASNACLAAVVAGDPTVVAGAADLTGNTGVKLSDARPLDAGAPDGRQIFFGVREHAMGSMMTGMALHGGLRPVGGTFLVFADYMRPAIRLAALSRANVVYSFTHDSVGVGEDGPTHQPVEQIMSLRLIPGLQVVRPADANETAAAWTLAADHDGPTALILTRQGVPTLAGTDAEGVRRGGYVLDGDEDPDVVLVGSGSEVAVCVDAALGLRADGRRVCVVSMPSWDRFERQSSEYRRSVLPNGVPSVSVEAGVTLGWNRYADASVGIDRFGASAPGSTVMAELGINPASVVAAATDLLS